MSPIATTATRTAKTTTPAPALPGGYAGKLLRVNLTTGKIWTQPWTPEEMRDRLGGIGLGARILWDEVPAEVALGPSREPARSSPPGPWRGCRCGAPAGSPWSRAAP